MTCNEWINRDLREFLFEYGLKERISPQVTVDLTELEDFLDEFGFVKISRTEKPTEGGSTFVREVYESRELGKRLTLELVRTRKGNCVVVDAGVSDIEAFC